MLQKQSVSNELLELLDFLMSVEEFNKYRLVGGTALALQWGHRESIDIDMFGDSDLTSDEIVNHLNSYGAVKILKKSKSINIFMVNNIKVDFVNYKYKWLDEIYFEDNIRMATAKDIAAMKINAITGRGSKKDFIDLYFLLNYFTLEEILSFFISKYYDATLFLAIKSLTYFDDADLQEMPKIFEKINWEDIKKTILKNYYKLNI